MRAGGTLAMSLMEPSVVRAKKKNLWVLGLEAVGVVGVEVLAGWWHGMYHECMMSHNECAIMTELS